MDACSELALAKVNLHLHVLGQQEDGYHLLDSLIVFARAADRLSVAPAAGLSLMVTGPFAASLSPAGDNLVLRAALGLAKRLGVKPTGQITLEKNLPVASGIGGGSADAAAALRLMIRHWNIRPDPSAVLALALELGADVPACLLSETVCLAGTGDRLRPIGRLPPIGLVLVNPRRPLLTTRVFKARHGPFSDTAAFPAEGFANAAALLHGLAATRNDLEAPARHLMPVIDDVLAAISPLSGCLLARMSGSGATCFGLFASSEAAEAAARDINRSDWWVWGGGIAS